MTAVVKDENLVEHGQVVAKELPHGYQDFINTVGLVIRREWRRLLSEPSRIAGIMVQPLLFLLVFGVGFHDNFHVRNSYYTYVVFLFPGILGLLVLFSSMYATLTLVEDKKCGFFRLVLSGPGGISAALVGKILATTSLGFIQGLVVMSLVFFLPVEMTLYGFFWLVIFLLLGAFCFSLIGVLLAWISETPSAFHALMSIILIPMWPLSGAMFPISSGVFYWLSFMNPMAYLVTGLRAAYSPTSSVIFSQFAMLLIMCFAVSLALVAVVKKRHIE